MLQNLGDIGDITETGVASGNVRKFVVPSVPDLVAKIRAFINASNQRKHPFIWTKTPDQILNRINRKRSNTTSH